MTNPKKPTAIRKLQGNPGKRPLPEQEPQPKLGIPTRPRWLSMEARRAWDELAPELNRIGLLSLVDGPALAVLCDAYADYIQARRIIRRKGHSVKTKLSVRPRPQVAAARESYARFKSLLAEFGLTPSARARLEVTPAPPEDPLARFDRADDRAG